MLLKYYYINVLLKKIAASEVARRPCMRVCVCVCIYIYMVDLLTDPVHHICISTVDRNVVSKRACYL